jgi:hypothetical protein
MHVDALEIAWTAIALVGLVLAIWNAIEAQEDRQILDEWNVDGGRRRAATMMQGNAIAIAFTELMLFLVGLGAAIEPPEVMQDRNAIEWAIITGLFLASGSLALAQGLTIRGRRRLHAYYELQSHIER